MSEDWNRIIAQGETMNVDFKGPLSWDGNDRGALAEDIVGMTNIRDGGLILIGVSEGADGNYTIDGLSADQAKTFDPTKVMDFVAGYFQPQVRLRVERPVVDGKQLVALRIEEFDQTPAICIKDGPAKPGTPNKRYFYEGNLIVRTPAAKTVVIRTAEDMHALIRLAVTKTSNRLLGDVRRLLEGRSEQPIARQPYDAALAVWTAAFAERVNGWKATYPGRGFFSFVLLPDRTVETSLDHTAMKKLVQDARVQVMGLELPSTNVDRFTSVVNIPAGIQGKLDLEDYQEVWQMTSSGAFMYGRLLLYRQLDQGPPFIP
ncbi:MAG TPA: ATP-binding protein, partial [Nitrolancea sp.]|nr:ATP-binding protein [Nitrolancea sp.]